MPVMDADEAMADHMDHGMSGMLSEEELAAMEGASGTEFDILFLEGMIQHHEGAIDMAEDVVDSQDPRVAALAKAIIETQQAEIDQMQSILDEIKTQPAP